MVRAPLDVVGEQLITVLERLGGDRLERAFYEPDRPPAGRVADLGLVRLGYAEQITDGAHGDLGTEIPPDEVEAVGARERVEHSRTELPCQWFDRGHPPRG